MLCVLRKKGYKVIAPTKNENSILLAPVTDFNEICLDYVRTINSPKHFLLPREEVLFYWSKKQEGIHIMERGKYMNIAFFGIHPCDANAIKIVDHLLLKNPADPYYQSRRNNCFIIVFDCIKDDEFCFCESVKARIPQNGSCDIWVVPQAQAFAVAPITEKGKLLLRELNLKSTKPPKLAKVGNSDRLSDVIDKLEGMYDSIVWRKLSEKCLLCGICTITCPTCVCFDIFDELGSSLYEGKRLRVWDSCIFRSFTMVAGGRIVRKEPADRFKFRFFHKFVFIKKLYSVYGCTGCGRCYQQCPTHINPLEVIREVVLHEPIHA